MKAILIFAFLFSNFSSAQPAASKCNRAWKKAALALDRLEDHPSRVLFSRLVEAVPAKSGETKSCKNRDVILHALDVKMNKLEKWSHSVYEFTRLLAKVQFIADGGVAEDICAEGPRLLQKNPRAFVMAIDLERRNMIDADCLVTSRSDLVDAPQDKIRAAFEKRLALLRRVKDKRLLRTRDDLIAAIRSRVSGMH